MDDRTEQGDKSLAIQKGSKTTQGGKKNKDMLCTGS